MDFDALMTSGRFMPGFVRETAKAVSGYPYLFDLLMITGAFMLGAIVAWLARKAFVRLGTALYARRANVDDEVRGEIMSIASNIVLILPVYTVCQWCWVEGMHVWVVHTLGRIGLAAICVLAARALRHGVNLLGVWYRRKLGSENRPIDGILATVRGFVVAAGVICAVSLLIGKSPFYLLSALGAAAAVLMLVFQDSLLSLAASVQVNSNRLINIGDWIVLKDKGVDGVVEGLTLHTVKVRNWDETLVALPVRTLVDEPFVNMTSMQESGGRRYLRDFLIDQRSVRFLRQDELEELRRFDLLFGKDAMPKGQGVADVRPYGPAVTGNRHQTNLGAFRAYLDNYLHRHPFICQNKDIVVTVNEPTSRGVPLEIYTFSNKTGYAEFSNVAADITEHVLAVLPSFHLRMFQDCSDIYQSVCGQKEVVDGFHYEKLAAPELAGLG